jgi:hypothetical protein
MTLGERLAHVYWLGGSPCSGKSTAADILAARFGMIFYRCDDRYHDHIEIISPQEQPVFHRLAQAMPDEIWLRPVEQQIAEEITLYEEEFPLILDDLFALPADRPVIAEGAALMPALLVPLGLRRERMAWMIPTETFQRIHYGRRVWRHDVLRECSDPTGAWENWMSRDAGFAREVARQAKDLGQCLLVTDGTHSIDDTAAGITAQFGLTEPLD